MSKHTPGPWRVLYGERNGDTQIMAQDDYFRVAVTGAADARLIAAAPDMLAALKALVEPPDLRDLRIEDWQNAIAAIAKAEGTS
jgi:hypothetical protein